MAKCANHVFVSQVMFTISQMAVSGLKVNRLDMYGEVSQVRCMLQINLVVVFSSAHSQSALSGFAFLSVEREGRGRPGSEETKGVQDNIINNAHARCSDISDTVLWLSKPYLLLAQTWFSVWRYDRILQCFSLVHYD